MKGLTKIGIALSAGWLAIMVILLARDVNGALGMKLNEAGDFLAGVTAPLALLWLIVGYFQHGEELKLNTKALQAQEEELRRQVEETATLARNAERQAKAAEDVAQLNKEEQEREEKRRATAAQPNFSRVGRSVSGGRIEVQIMNRGARIRDVKLIYQGPCQLEFPELHWWDRDSTEVLTLIQDRRGVQYPIAFKLLYTDGLDARQESVFELQKNHEIQVLAGSADEIPS